MARTSLGGRNNEERPLSKIARPGPCQEQSNFFYCEETLFLGGDVSDARSVVVPGIGDDREEADRQLDQLFRPMGHVRIEIEAVTGRI